MTAETKKGDYVKTIPTALVAGGAGFIGSFLCETLLSQNYRVYCLDNLSTGSKENIKELLVNPNFHFIEGDITQPLEFLPSIENLDCIFHLVALEIQSDDKKFSLETLLVNSSGTRNLLEAAKSTKAKFILVSSGDIYQGSFSSSSFRYYFGEGKSEILMSQHEAKRFAEALTVEFCKNYDVDAVIARVSDVYGPRMNLKGSGELTRLIALAKTGDKLLVVEDGLFTINPTYVSDVVFGLIKIAAGDFKGEIFNLINSEKTTVMGLAETLRLIVGNLEIVSGKSDSPLDFPPAPLELETTKEKLKWHPRVNLAEGLSSTLQSFSEVQPAKMVSFTTQSDQEPQAEKPQPKRKAQFIRKNHIRLAIFSLSLLLIVLTTIVPFALFIKQAGTAFDQLNKAQLSLQEDKTKATTDLAVSAVGSAQKADQSLNNVRWVFQLLGQRESLRANEQLLFAIENTSVGVKLLSQVVGEIIAAEDASKLSDKTKAADHLQVANQLMIEAQQNLDLAKASLLQVKKNKLAPTLSSRSDQVGDINTKVAASAAAIAQSLDNSLQALDEASTSSP